jgi:hypothetical protein
MTSRLLLLACLLLAACNKGGDGLDKCGVSVGTCNPGSTSCGIQLACEGKLRELKCTIPAADAKTIECQCAENGVIGDKKLQIAYPMQGDARAVASSACGWAR